LHATKTGEWLHVDGPCSFLVTGRRVLFEHDGGTRVTVDLRNTQADSNLDGRSDGVVD
jgi:hypothetical protein